jgi:hypothetical protein
LFAGLVTWLFHKCCEDTSWPEKCNRNVTQEILFRHLT